MGTSGSKAPSVPSSTPVISVVNYGSINSHLDDVSAREALCVGTAIGNRVSAVRRFFCLLTTFDLLFTVLLWLICVMIQHLDVITAFTKDFLGYNIQTSLFDLVMLSAGRFTFIIAFYALLRISHWWVIAVTTAVSGAFIIAKVFLYHWDSSSSKTAAIVLLLSSFVLSWGEAWFLDFRVLPIEEKASILFARHVNARTPRVPDRRSSLSSSLSGGFYSPDEARYINDRTLLVPDRRPSLSGSLSEDGFYSPEVSEDESTYDDYNASSSTMVTENQENQTQEERAKKILTLQEKEYKRQAEEALEAALKLLSSSAWRTEVIVGEDTVQSCRTPEFGKIFKFIGTIHVSPQELLNILFTNPDDVCKWNPTVRAMQVLQAIDRHTDVVHVVSAEGVGGLVSSRDFVNVRCWQKRGQMYLVGMTQTTHPMMPVQAKYIRGEQGPSLYVLNTVEGHPQQCHVQWLLNTSLKGWLPQYVIDQTLTTIMLDCMKAFRQHVTCVV